MNKTKPRHRHMARRFALQALYQWHLTNDPLEDIGAQFLTTENCNKMDQEYFTKLLFGIPNEATQIEEKIAPCLDRNYKDLDPIERMILAIGVYEFTHNMDVPYKVVINEGVELGKIFGATDSYKYINGVLDKLAKELRAVEFDN